MLNDEQYDDWNYQKKKIKMHTQSRFFKEGEIWWCSIGLNIGEEVYGKGMLFKRPVIVLRKLTKKSCIVIPITSKPAWGTWYFPFEIDSVERYAMMHQMRMVSVFRFESRMATIRDHDFLAMKKAVASLLGFF